MKILLHKRTQTLKPYPRDDDEPVVGLSDEYEVFDVIQESRPPHNETTETCSPTETIDTQAKRVTRGWSVTTRPVQPKMWRDAQKFMAAFTMPEKAAMALSADPTVAALRLELSTWLSAVHVDDARVQAGLNKLVELGIISEPRKTNVIATAS